MRPLGVVLLATLVGCSLGDDFQFVPDDTGASDTATAIDSAVFDSGAIDAILPSDDAASSDADGGADAGDSRPSDAPFETAPPLAGCAGLTGWTLCRDFDTAALAKDGWTDDYVTGSATLSLDTMRSHSPSKSMRSSLLPSTLAAANVHREFVSSPTTRPMAIDFWVWFDTIPAGKGPLLVKLARDAANKGVALYVGEGGFAVDANGPAGTTNHKMTGTLGAGKWLHVRLEASLSASTTGWFKLYVDDMKSPKLERSGLATTTVDASDLKINVGFYAEPAIAINAWFDDVAFYWL